MIPVIGVDPGGASTGIVVRLGDRLLDWALVERAEPEEFDAYLGRVMTEITTAGNDRPHALLAVEDLNHPNPHLGLANVEGLMATAQVLGAIRRHATRTYLRLVLVPPGRHGSAPLQSYPRELVGERERAGTGRMRHLRSAWDVAGAAKMQVLLSGEGGRVMSAAPMTTTTPPNDELLAKFAEFYRRQAVARDFLSSELRSWVRRLNEAGVSAKGIAEAAGMSRQRVYELLKELKNADATEEPHGKETPGAATG